MFVEDRMSRPVIMVHPDMSMEGALCLMRNEHIRHLPVVNEQGKLVGIVSERDLLLASPSNATIFSVWELNYSLSKISIDGIMTREVITVTEDTLIAEAARIMADKKIGSLPVVRDGEVVGIITENDILKAS